MTYEEAMLKVIKGVVTQADCDMKAGHLESRLAPPKEGETDPTVTLGVAVFLTHEQINYMKYLVRKVNEKPYLLTKGQMNAQSNRNTSRTQRVVSPNHQEQRPKSPIQAGDLHP